MKSAHPRLFGPIIPLVALTCGLAPAGCLGGQTGQPSSTNDGQCDERPLETISSDELRSFLAQLEGHYSAPLYSHQEIVAIPTSVDDMEIEHEGSIEIELRYVGTPEPSGRCGISLPFEVTVSTDDGSFDGAYLATVPYDEDFDSKSRVHFSTVLRPKAPEAFDEPDDVPYGVVLVDDELALELPTGEQFFEEQGVLHQDDCSGNESELAILDGELRVLLCLEDHGLKTGPVACGGVGEMSYDEALEAGLGFPESSGARLSGQGAYGLRAAIEFEPGAAFCLTSDSDGVVPGKLSLWLGDERVEVESSALSSSGWTSEIAARYGDDELCLSVEDEEQIEKIQDALLEVEVIQDCHEDEEFICERSQAKRDALLAIIDDGIESVELCPTELRVVDPGEKEPSLVVTQETNVKLYSAEGSFSPNEAGSDGD